MTKRKVWRYRCEFCKKSGCSAGHIARHESGCTANPNRICRMHRYIDSEQKPMADMIAVLTSHKDGDWNEGLERLRSLVGNCPACILAAIRQSDLQGFDGENYPKSFDFDFKAECKALFEEVNQRGEW